MFDELFERVVKLNEKLSFLGTCKDIVDPEDMEEVSHLQGMVEGGKEIAEEDFLSMVEFDSVPLTRIKSNPDNFEYFYNEDEKIAWFYDSDEDVEYFFG